MFATGVTLPERILSCFLLCVLENLATKGINVKISYFKTFKLTILMYRAQLEAANSPFDLWVKMVGLVRVIVEEESS